MSTPGETTSAQAQVDASPPGSEAKVQAAAAALAAYHGYWKAVVKARSIPDPRYPDLEKYATDKALANEYSSLLLLEREGIIYRGEPMLVPVVASVELGADPVVTITDCVDSTKWQPVYKATGESAAAPEQSPRVPGSAAARPLGDNWLITSIDVDRSRTC
jgi:hypothetical protein